MNNRTRIIRELITRFQQFGVNEQDFDDFTYNLADHPHTSSLLAVSNFLLEKKLPPKTVFSEISGLSFHQMQALQDNYDFGLRGEHLRAGKASGNKFTSRHLWTLTWLIKEKGCRPDLAPQALSEHDSNYDEMQAAAYPAYLKLDPRHKLGNPVQLDKNERVNLVVGLGPAGLASALELLRSDSKHRKVVAFTNREDYTRRAAIKIEHEDYEYFKSFVPHDKTAALENAEKVRPDYDRMRHHGVVSLQTREIETHLFAELEKYQQSGMLEIINISRDPESSIKSIDKFSHKVILKNGRELPFDIIAETDGANHALANMLSDAEDMPIAFYKTQDQQMHKHHAVVNFRLPQSWSASEYRKKLLNREDVIALDRIRDYDPETLSRLKSLGWEFSSLPETRIFALDGLLYVGSECPKNMYDTPEKREQWSREVLRSYLPQLYINWLNVYTNKTDSQGFKIVLDEAEQPVYKFPKYFYVPDLDVADAYLVIMGDASRKSHFETGSGALTGFRQVKAFGEFLKSNQKRADWEALTKRLNDIRDINRERINRYIEMRRERELTAKKRALSPSRNVSNPRPHKRKEYLDLVYAQLGVNRYPLYVCDHSVAMQRFEGAVASKNPGKRSSREEEIAVDDLQAHIFRRTAKIIRDCTSDFSSAREKTTSPGSVNDLRLSFVTNNSPDNPGKTYHFFKFNLVETSTGYRVTNPICMQLIIYENGQVILDIPHSVEKLDHFVRGRSNLSIEKLGNQTTNELEISRDIFSDYETVLRENKINGTRYHLRGNNIDAVLKEVHRQFCVNPASTPERLIDVFHGKISRFRIAHGNTAKYHISHKTNPFTFHSTRRRKNSDIELKVYERPGVSRLK